MGIQDYQAKELPFVLDTKCWLEKLMFSWENESDLYSCCRKPQISEFQDMMIYLKEATTIFDTKYNCSGKRSQQIFTDYLLSTNNFASVSHLLEEVTLGSNMARFVVKLPSWRSLSSLHIVFSRAVQSSSSPEKIVYSFLSKLCYNVKSVF